MFDLAAIQNALAEFELDAWLLSDFRGSNPLAHKVLDISPDAHQSRRWMYLIPRVGQPKKLVHRIESGQLDHLPGEKRIYLKWQEFETGVAWLLSELLMHVPRPQVAMEYSPRNAIPYISRVDGGTIELVTACGGHPVSSGNLIQRFEAIWSPAQWESHQAADKVTTSAYDVVWSFLQTESLAGREPHETDVQDLIMDHFAKHHCVTDHPPIVGVNAHAGNPHYAPVRGHDSLIRNGDLVLVDLWCKQDRPNAVFSDLTRMGYLGTEVPQKYGAIFTIVAAARDAAIALVKDRFAKGQPLAGWEVDAAARRVIDSAGYGDSFVHRTGHNIGEATHGNGAHMDNLETRDERLVLRQTCFSIEPGIYLPEFGVRSEINVYIDNLGGVHVTGGPLQTAIVPILAR